MTNQEAIETLRANYPDAYYEQLREAVDVAIEALKAQNGTDTNVGSNDLISRQAAIDALDTGLWGVEWDKALATAMLKDLPSAQPEKLTDKEQRIFLSAMGREEEVCKEVDDAWRDSREPYEDSLVYVCKEIKRKVKGALWT